MTWLTTHDSHVTWHSRVTRLMTHMTHGPRLKNSWHGHTDLFSTAFSLVLNIIDITCLFYVSIRLCVTDHVLQVSALLGRIPSAVGYQPTLATDMGTMQERITTTKVGSITSVQVSFVSHDSCLMRMTHCIHPSSNAPCERGRLGKCISTMPAAIFFTFWRCRWNYWYMRLFIYFSGWWAQCSAT